MQEDVGEQRADARALGRSFHRIGVHATLQDASAVPIASLASKRTSVSLIDVRAVAANFEIQPQFDRNP
jgi:hypothetical protein